MNLYGIIYNDYIIIGYHDNNPNLYIYDNSLNLLSMIYESDDYVNSLCIYQTYLIVGYTKSIKFYDKNFNCIGRFTFNNTIKYINSSNNYLYIVMNNEYHIYKFNN